MLIGQVKKRDLVLTNFSIKLIGTSLSKRMRLARTDKLEGKIRQEHVILHLGFLCSLNVISNPLKKLNSECYPIEDFNITVMNSLLLKDRQSVININRQKISQSFSNIPKTTSMNSHARQWQLHQFLEGKDGNSPLSSHYDTVRFLKIIYSRLKIGLKEDRIIHL